MRYDDRDKRGTMYQFSRGAVMEEKRPNLKLRNARTRNNWKQQDVADRIGATALSVGRWERGEAFPSAYYRQQLCDLFGMSLEELGFTGEEVSQPSQRSDTEAYGADTETSHQHAGERSTPLPQKGKSRKRLMLVGILCALLVISGVIMYGISLAHPSVTKPGGGWISPMGKTVKGKIYFAA